MCGITGFIDFAGHPRDAARARVARMADALVHRGPDEAGYYVDDHAALGHRRLAIIDLSGGQQPMSVLNGQVQVVFNGEIYNFLELRAELEALGHVFKTHSDTEAILLAYVQWGDACVSRLHGMFAFAIWDARHRALLLARDRVGKKPLYYYRNGSTIAFASELKSLLAGGFCPTTLDPESLDCYFTFGYIPAPRTIYRGVNKLRAAHSMRVTEGSQTERQYWNLSFSQAKPRSLDDATDEFEELLDEAVKCRLMSEVPLGAFLSGGIDSSLVVSSMAQLDTRPVISNSIGFDDREFNELTAAKAIANALHTNHHEYVCQPQVTDILPKIAWHCDEPLADSSTVPTWYVCEMARRNVTVAISGDGGDESFGGYTFRYVPHQWESSLRARIPAALRAALFGPLGALWPASAKLPQPLRLKTIFENLAVGDAEAYCRDLAWLRADARAAVYSPDFLSNLKGFTAIETVYPYYANNDAPDALSRAQYADIHFYMTDDVLTKVDRISMAHSLEVRSPFMDHRVIEFAARLPADLKIQGRTGKVLLRNLAARRLPPEVQNLPKRGFSIPAAQWLRNELRTYVEDIVLRSELVDAHLNKAAVQKMWTEHLQGARDHSVFLWGLMTLGLWDRARHAAAA